MRSVYVEMCAAILACGLMVSCADAVGPASLTSLDYVLAESGGALNATPITLIAIQAPAASVPPIAATCPYDATSTMFVCPAQTQGEWTFRVSYQLLDAGGQALATRSSSLIAAVRSVRTADYVALVAGTQFPNVHNRSDRTLSGLLTGDHVIYGQDTVSRFFGLGSTVWMSIDAVTAANFRPRKLPIVSSYPASGTITVRSSFTLPAAQPDSSSTVMTFNGTSRVTWSSTSAGVTRTCTYILDVGGAPQCS